MYFSSQVAKLAATGRLQCKIDSVARSVVTSVHLSDEAMRLKDISDLDMDRSMLYKATVKGGDILLNRLKKLARVMDF